VSSRAVIDGLLAGLVIGLPPILNYGSPELQRKVVPDVSPLLRIDRGYSDVRNQALAGRKYIALAISEAFAGSDVGGLQTTAVRDGDDWIVTGTKKYVVEISVFHRQSSPPQYSQVDYKRYIRRLLHDGLQDRGT